MSDPPQTGHRGAARFLAGLPAVLHLDGGDFPCEAHNLSRTGVLLIGKLPDTEADVSVTLRSPKGDLELRVRGRVRRLQDVDGKAQLGVEFGAIDQAGHDVLEALVARVVEGMRPAALDGLPAKPRPGQVREALEQIPVPHRISLAMRGLPHDRELLLQDPSPNVLEGLARNPNMQRHELRALLRLHTLLPTTLDLLARDTRWRQDEEFQMAIVCHPRCPLPVAQRIVDQLSPLGKKKVITRPGLNPTLRLQLGKRKR